VRKVNKGGVFNFYAQRVYVGYAHTNKTLSIRYDMDSNRFRLMDQTNTTIGYIQADNFSQEHVLGLRVCQNRYIVYQT